MGSSSFDSTELPVLSPRNYCVLILRDPHFIYAYWDYSQKDIDRLQHPNNGKAPKFIVRVYEAHPSHSNGSAGKHSWDIEVGFSVKSSYIHVEHDNADYCIEIGLSWAENDFVALAKSNTAHTPPKTASSRDDLIWQDIKFHRESLPYVRRDISARREAARKKAMQRQKGYELSSRDLEQFFAPSGENGPSLEQILKGKWPGVSLEKVHSLMKAPDLVRRLHPGASEQFSFEETSEQGVQAGGASELLGASAQLIAGSEERLGKRKFFFEVWTELVVHGRTEPDAVVWLNSKGVKLNPDGTFSLRYALPDGDIPLQFIAQSSDGIEQRHIYTRVERAKTTGFPKMLKEFRG